jgi:hypothetical protein
MAGAVCWYGCSIYNSSLLLPAADSGVKDVFIPEAGTDAHDSGVEAGPPVCPEVFPPPVPAADDPNDGGDQAFVVAVHTIDIGGGDGGLGYDLDQVYTCCDGGAPSCGSAVTGATNCDDSNGRDNRGGHLFEALASLDSTQFNTTTISQRVAAGTYSILLQVLHYNGTANDTQVTAALYASDGVENDAGAMWNGQDSWTIDQAFVTDPDASPLLPTRFDADAYVADGVFVMHVNFPISLGTSATDTFQVDLSAGLVTGQLVPATGGGYSLENGIITGRWNVTSMLASLSTLNVANVPLCQGSTYYGVIKSEVCQYSDIMTDPNKDRTGATCDALSLAIGFTADPALMGDVVASPIKTSLCPPDAGPDNCQM